MTVVLDLTWVRSCTPNIWSLTVYKDTERIISFGVLNALLSCILFEIKY